MSFHRPLCIVLVVAIQSLSNFAKAQQRPDELKEEWDGARSREGKSQPIVLHIVQSGQVQKATVDLPDFGALAIPASGFAVTAARIHFELVGDSATAIFEGNVSGDAAHGTWKEDGRSGTFELKRVQTATAVFREENVSFMNGVVRLAGTLLLPSRSTPAPAIVFVQGSGPEQRYASRFLAEFFVRRGIAALIYDKRGAGESSGDWKRASFEDLARDVTASVAFLRGRNEIDQARIGLMGSSQGGWIAPMAATQMPGLAFVIVKSAAAVTPERQELARVNVQMTAEGYSAAEIAAAAALYIHAIAYARTGSGWDSLAHEIELDSGQKWTLFPAGTPKDYWFFDQIRSDFDHDPIAVIRELKSPLLMIFGGEDDDGPSLQDSLGPLLDALRAGPNRELEIFPAAGHDLRIQPDKEAWDFSKFAPGYLDSLASWVELHTR